MLKTEEKIRNIKEADNNISKVIRANLQQLMKLYGIKVSRLCQYLEDNDAFAPHRTTFSRFMNGEYQNISVAFLLGCCKCFELSLDNLLSENFNPNENNSKFVEKYAHLFEKQKKDAIKKQLSEETKGFFLPGYVANEVFVENPKSPILKPYIQTYHCYYYSTVSSENRTNDSMIHGTLKLEEDGIHCTATLEIDTKTYNERGEPNYKIYKGNVVVCPSIQSIHCILMLPSGEFCFLIFRYSHLNIASQECRIAEVLSTSSTPDKRYPIVQRMLLCNKEIEKEDLDVIAPHLWLNYSDIMISEFGLLSVKECSENYARVIDEILDTDAELVYRLKEKEVINKALESLSEEEIPLFLTELRKCSFAHRYNKVSMKADNNIRDVLVQLGYFRPDNKK